ncbi:MAG: TIGR02300 family protein [Methyloceanibacter sp.]
MSKPAKGTKRVCPSCGARFYDLSRTPVICPVCQAVYQVTPPPTRRGERAAPPEARPKVQPAIKVPAVPEPDTISLEDAEAGETIPIESEEEIVDLGDDADEIPAATDDDNTFLEEQPDEEPDVSGIVGTPGEET